MKRVLAAFALASLAILSSAKANEFQTEPWAPGNAIYQIASTAPQAAAWPRMIRLAEPVLMTLGDKAVYFDVIVLEKRLKNADGWARLGWFDRGGAFNSVHETSWMVWYGTPRGFLEVRLNQTIASGPVVGGGVRSTHSSLSFFTDGTVRIGGDHAEVVSSAAGRLLATERLRFNARVEGDACPAYQ